MLSQFGFQNSFATKRATKLRLAALESLPHPDEFMNKTAHIWISETSEYGGDASSVTSIVNRGLLSLNWNAVGSGNTIVAANGFTFSGGVYLNNTSMPSGTYSGAYVVIDVTLTGAPIGSSSAQIMNLENELAGRFYSRYIASGAPQILMPNNQTLDVDYFEPLGNRQRIGMFVNGSEGCIIEADGIEKSTTVSVPGNILLNSSSIGRYCAGTIHRLGVFLISPEDTSWNYEKRLDIWERMFGTRLHTIVPNVVQYIPVDGQSLSVGGTYDTSNRTVVRNRHRRVYKNPAGLLREDDTAVTVLGTGLLSYNTATAASGYASATPHNNQMTVAYPFALSLIDFRAERNLPTKTVSAWCVGASGAAIEDFDSNVSSGNGNTLIWNNKNFWLTQANAVLGSNVGTVPYLIFVHGTSAKHKLAGEYYVELNKYWTENKQLIESKFPGSSTKLLLTQDAGDTATSTGADTWEVCRDQWQFAIDNADVELVTPLYPFPVSDNSVHPDGPNTALFSETIAWAASELEAGRSWTIPMPQISKSDNVVSVVFSLRADETLVVHEDKYNGEAINNIGFEAGGAEIQSVVVAGNTVTVYCNTSPSSISYAGQKSDTRNFVNNKYVSHRGLLRTSLTANSKMFPSETLYRWIPSIMEIPLP